MACFLIWRGGSAVAAARRGKHNNSFRGEAHAVIPHVLDGEVDRFPSDWKCAYLWHGFSTSASSPNAGTIYLTGEGIDSGAERSVSSLARRFKRSVYRTPHLHHGQQDRRVGMSAHQRWAGNPMTPTKHCARYNSQLYVGTGSGRAGRPRLDCYTPAISVQDLSRARNVV